MHTRSRRVEMPSGRSLPLAFGINTRLRSEEHTSELQSRLHLVCRLLLEKKNTYTPAEARAFFEKSAPGFLLVPQRGADPADRPPNTLRPPPEPGSPRPPASERGPASPPR